MPAEEFLKGDGILWGDGVMTEFQKGDTFPVADLVNKVIMESITLNDPGNGNYAQYITHF